jgi:SET domain-containing protein
VHDDPVTPAPASSFGEHGAATLRPSPIHGLGAFAARNLPAGMRLVEYVGEKISKAESIRRCAQNNRFIFALDEEVDLDGHVPWNPARFVNHSCRPNCDVECIDGRLWVIARRDIRAGEELTFNYGYDLESYRDYPCRCGASDCVGYIVAVEFFPMLRNIQPPPSPAPLARLRASFEK